MIADRPDPDALLRQVRAEEDRTRRGSLKIFFGYAAGVGKTYAMLEAAQRAALAGRDLVVGYVEPHGRRETEVLLEGLEAIPTRSVEYRGVQLREFDLDAAVARQPEVILVDELAHTNAEGSRHARRWQDVEELLEAGIHVWTTLNVQHIDSLNDVIGRIVGVTVRETVPDAIFDGADDLELVDLTPEDLLDRLKAGRVYAPDQARAGAPELLPAVEPRRPPRVLAPSGRAAGPYRRGIGPAGAVPPWETLADRRAVAGLRRPRPEHRSGDPDRQADGRRARCPLARRVGRPGGQGGQRPYQGADRRSLPPGRTPRRRDRQRWPGEGVAATLLEYAPSPERDQDPRRQDRGTPLAALSLRHDRRMSWSNGAATSTFT